MAVDRSRLAAALAYKQAEEERRRRMLESIPTPAGTAPAEPAPQADFRTNLENLSIGVGEGLTNQLEGIKGLVTDPVGTAKGVYEAGKAVVRDPAIIASALRQMGQKAMSGPLGAGEVIGEMLGPRKTGPVMAELDVYHGTPHRFPATEANPFGEFDASKIGTGEGAQAYGHGVYLAENPGVARSYIKTPEDWAVQANVKGSAYRKAQAEMTKIERELRQKNGANIPKGEISAFMYAEKNADKFDSKLMERIRAVRQAEEKAYKDFSAGSFYKADLPDEMIDRMLDYDKPLTQQPKNVQAALAKLGNPQEKLDAYDDALLKALFEDAADPGSVPRNPSGADILKKLENQYGRKGASDYLRELGIPGIRYLDAGSRGQGGSGTRNFVVFPGEEKKVRILERDGQKAPPQKIAQALEEIKPVTTAVEIPEALHGSPVRGLTELSPSKAMEVRGTTWFSDNADIADQYTFPREYGEILYDAEPGEIYKAGLSFKNPLIVDFKGKVGDATELSKLVEQAKKQGYDGLIVRNVDDSIDSSKVLGTSYAVFDRNQIKLKK